MANRSIRWDPSRPSVLDGGGTARDRWPWLRKHRFGDEYDRLREQMQRTKRVFTEHKRSRVRLRVSGRVGCWTAGVGSCCAPVDLCGAGYSNVWRVLGIVEEG